MAPDPSLDEFQIRKAIADAEKAAIEVEIARDDAKKKLAASQTPSDPEKKARDAALDAAKSAKEMADAQKAQADAQAAALKAKFGDIPQSGISGSVKADQSAGSFETALLAARAANKASLMIAEAVVQTGSAAQGCKLLVYAAGEVPGFQAVTGFLCQCSMILQALVDAVALSDQSAQAEVAPRTESIAVAGLALDAATKLLGYFKSDYELKGSEVAPDHVLLAKMVAGALLVKLKEKNVVVYLKETFNPTAVAMAEDGFKSALGDLVFQRNRAAAALIVQERTGADLAAKLTALTGDTPQDRELKGQLGKQQMRQQGVADKLKAALAAYDTLASKLASADPSVTALMRELDVWNMLRESSSLLLVVKMEKAGGSNFTIKNILTGLGRGMPFYAMGGVIASYALFQGSTGTLLASELFPVPGKFVGIDKIG